MGLRCQKILGIKITISSRKTILEEIRKCFKKDQNESQKSEKKAKKPVIILTPNPEIITFAQNDRLYKRIVNSAQINIPDGWGVVWGIKKMSGLTIEKISGADLMWDICKLAADNSLVIGLIGGRGQVAVRTGECLRETHPGLKIQVLETENFGITNHKLIITNKIQNPKSEKDVKKAELIYFASLIDKIIKERIDILFVALGFPKQEYFIDSVKREALSVKYDRPLVMMAVGGAFDYLSGKVPRAPKWMRQSGLEWLFRLIREPWRLPRQIKGAEFFWRIIIELYTSHSNYPGSID